MTDAQAQPQPPVAPAPLDLVRSRKYVALLLLGAVVGVPVAAIAYEFLRFVSEAQTWLFTTLPNDLGFDGTPAWWPLPAVALGGLLVGLTLHFLPGTGGENPAEGFKTAGVVEPRDLPSIICASLATLMFGAVLGPEAPLVLIGAGVAVLIVRLIKSDAPDQAVVVIGAAGSFAAISTLLISPLAGAFLLLEAAGIGGGLISVILLPGMLAAGIGSLVFIGLSSATGSGTYSLALPDIPHVNPPTFAEFLWAIGIGLVAPVIGIAIRRLAFQLQPLLVHRKVLLTPLFGLAVGGLAVLFQQVTDHPSSYVLFSGESALAPLIQEAGAWSVGALVMLVICKGLAYSVSLSAFRGGPTFPGMFIGAAGGMALSHLPGLPMVAGVGMGIGAMTVVMLGGLPLSSVLLTLLFLQSDALDLISVVIVAVVVAYVGSAWLQPWLHPKSTGAVEAGAGPDVAAAPA